MDILEKNTNIVFSGVLDYSSCDNITSFESDKRKDYELYKTLISKFINTKYTVFLKESDVNKKNVLQKIYAALNNQESKDLFIFYFTGHGILSNNGEPGLLMSDSNIITKTELKNILQQNNKNQKMILFGDFCYSGLLADIARDLNLEGLDINAITSASSNLSTGNWSYTQTLIDSFEGRSIIDKNNKGFINFIDIAKEVQNVMFNRERQKSDYYLLTDLENSKISNAKIKIMNNTSNVKYDGWYSSNEGITRVTDFKDDLFEVEYYNYNEYKFVFVKESELSPIQIAEFEKGDHINVDCEEGTFRAIIEEVDRIFYKVSYEDWGPEWNEWITKHRINGDEKVEIFLDDNWYPGEILQVKNNKFFIRYDGYDTCFDEWVESTRIKKL